MKKNSNKKPIFIIIFILFILLIFLLIAMYYLKSLENKNNNFVFQNAEVVDTNSKLPNRSIKEIIEDAGSKYINRTGKVIPIINVEFKLDLYDKNGRSQKNYFYDLIKELVPEMKESFYLNDESKNINIYVYYNTVSDTYEITINNMENFYDETDGEDYVNIGKAEIVKRSDFVITDPIFTNLANKNMYYSNTIFSSSDRQELQNGYFSYNDGAIYAKLLGGRVMNTVLTKKYTEEIGLNTRVGTNLSEIDEHFSNLAFGSVKDGYLGYRTNSYYVFIYDDQISLYEYRYEENNYFDEYLNDYCKTGDLEKLYQNFTGEWTSYFQNEFDPSSGKLKLTFPTRGIDIDITGNDSRGIKIYSNYYLTDTVKELIKLHKITLVGDKDLIHLTEIARRQSMR